MNHRAVATRDSRSSTFTAGFPRLPRTGIHPQGIASTAGTRPVDHSAIEPIRAGQLVAAAFAGLILAAGVAGLAFLILKLAGVIEL